MDDQTAMNLSNQDDASKQLEVAIATKIKYLDTLKQALAAQDDRLVYQLIDAKRYANEILQSRTIAEYAGFETLVKNLTEDLSVYLSTRLVAYLHEAFPFFYFNETKRGKFEFYFGNWWGRRKFGELDVINVKFNFDQVEFKKLSASFALESSKKRLNTDKISAISKQSEQLQKLIDSQDQRDIAKEKIRRKLKENAREKVMLWEASKQKDAKLRLTEELSKLTAQDEQANAAYDQLKRNKEQILQLSKEDTLLSYEKQSIVTKFGSFENFNDQVENLYRNYLAQLIAQKGQVSANE